MSMRPNALAPTLEVFTTAAWLSRSTSSSQVGEQEVRVVVDLHGPLVAVLGDEAFGVDAAGVVGQHVDAVDLPKDLRTQGADVGEPGEVGDKGLSRQRLGHVRELLRRATQEQPVTALGEPPRGCCSDAVRGSGDDDGSACCSSAGRAHIADERAAPVSLVARRSRSCG